ncbi:ABC transporter permease [Brevibacillus sp. H7]|uniref:ABC transporter permease n=1 Tax=Brevibacillus sp. H7 TaxID=3349138 RepID=UPI0037FEDD70
MAMLYMIVRKMWNNRWLVTSLLLGLVIAVSLVSSIPAFTSGVLQRVLVKDLEEYQKRVKQFPGGLIVSLDFNKVKPDSLAIIEQMEQFVQEEIIDRLDVPIYQKVTLLQTVPFEDAQNSGSASLRALGGIEEHITVLDGRLPSRQPIDGVFEALVTEGALKKRSMVLNTVFELTTKEAGGMRIRVKPVGVFTEKQGNDPYWFTPAAEYNNSFLIDERLFREAFMQQHSLLSSARLYTAFQYHAMKVTDKDKLLSVEPSLEQELERIGLQSSEYSIRFPVTSIVNKYDEKREQFQTILWSLYVPVFVMLALYLIMVAGLIIERQRTEIAVLGSRGASRRQIFFIYLVEMLILGGTAFLIGPFLGAMVSRLLGVSNGFLEFVNRTGLPVEMSREVFIYAFWTVLACNCLVLTAVFFATRQNIVSHKQQAARMAGTAVWHKLYLDILLLLVSWYGWYSYRKTVEDMKVVKEHAGLLQIDMLLFFVPVLFTLGFGLLCLRLYPWLIRAIFWGGKRFWSTPMFVTLVQVGRSARQYQFLMMFVAMTVAVGMYSASTARTINQNAEERLRYENGADVRMKVEWQNDQPVMLLHRGAKSGGEGERLEEPKKPPVKYVEPDFQLFARLPGVEHAAKVFVKDTAESIRNGKTLSNVKLMAVEPKEFALTAWFKPGLLPHHFYEYANLLAKEPGAVLISRSVAEQLKVSPGQTIELGWKDARPAEFVVYAVLDYWPGWNPHPVTDQYGRTEEQMLVVANLPFVQDRMRVEPYEVWMKLKPGATAEALYSGIKQANLRVTDVSNVSQKLIELKTSAFYLGLNGSLTLGFLLSMLITFTGYLMYWVLTLGSRKLQYGVFRAMGLSFPQLVRILAWEQALTFGAAFLLGIAGGKLCNTLFLPALGIYLEAGDQVPPFAIVSRTADELVIYGFVGVTLAVGIAILAALLSRLQIHQAVKLGED